MGAMKAWPVRGISLSRRSHPHAATPPPQWNRRRSPVVLESRAKALFVHHPEPIFELDPEGRFRHSNVAGANLAGLNENEGQGMHFTRFVLPQDRQEVERHFQLALNGRHTGCMAHIRNLASEEYHVTLHMLPITSKRNTLGVYVLVNPSINHTDLSGSLAAQRLLDAIPLGAAVLAVGSETHSVVMANRALGELLDMPLEVILGHPLPSLQESESVAVCRLQQALATRQPARESLSISRRGGRSLGMLLHLEPIEAPGDASDSACMLALHIPQYGHRRSPPDG
ncbi:MAG: PAS domain-containing protein [Halomonas sp.]|uniref:PAS domain-containing protein n=1 Tax=Halomonas sp. TaxID=1486246 RepID=UPI0028705B44|nr:PAS domain-containing protein [Halomonas sp.]MDR9440496.1 PAS domain-containing protein [Halomonas sp.]